VTLSDSSGTLSGISELMRLSLDGAGNVKGRIVLNLAGEVCTIATTGTYNVNFGGLGTMNLTWNTATGDADGDANCATSLNRWQLPSIPIWWWRQAAPPSSSRRRMTS
jgi:hypothetical protein